MKIQCDSCKASYNIPEEKLQGRPFRFTCKRCGNTVRYRPQQPETEQRKMTMEVRAEDVQPRMTAEVQASENPEALDKTVFQPQGQAQVRQPQESTVDNSATRQDIKVQQKSAEAPQPRMTIDGMPLQEQPVAQQTPWYIAYSKNKRGPLTMDQIQSHLMQTKVKGEIYVWQAGFENWLKIEYVPEFAPVLRALREAAKPQAQASAISPELRPKAPETQAHVPLQSLPQRNNRPSFTDLLKSELGDAVGKMGSTASQKIDISQLMERTGATETNLPIMQKAGRKKAAGHGVAFEEYRPPEKKKIPVIPIIILLFLFVLVVATPLTLAYKQVIEIPGLDKTPLIGKYFKKEEVDHYAKLRAQWEMLVKIDQTKIAMQAAKEEAYEEEQKRLAEEARKAKLEQQARLQRSRARSSQRRRTGNSSVTEFDFGDGPDGTEMETIGELKTTNIQRKQPLTQSEVNKVIMANKGRIGSCVAGQKNFGESIHGSLSVRFTISRRGSVVRAAIETSKFQGTYVGDCVAATIERLRFPRSGASTTISFPFKI